MTESRRRFRFLKEIAQGGFGKVYLAEMITGENFSSVVAIKLLHGKWLENNEIVARSRDEARLLGKLRHRNIVRVEDLTTINGQCAVVMEYLQGVDVKNIINWLYDSGRPFPRQAAFEIIGAVAAALDAAYNTVPIGASSPLQVIHRDIKPSNVMITVEGEVKTLDFGTARATFDEREAKTQALAFGSQAYMAPERLMLEPDTPAGDVFSLGVSLFEMLTLGGFGKIYIRQEKFEDALKERLAQVDFSSLPPELQTNALDTLRLMLDYDPAQRPSATQVIELMEVLAEQARDGGLKRIARESIKDIMQAHVHEPDPNDPYTGSVVFEDASAPGMRVSGPQDLHQASGPRPGSGEGSTSAPMAAGTPLQAVQIPEAFSESRTILPPMEPEPGAMDPRVSAPKPVTQPDPRVSAPRPVEPVGEKPSGGGGGGLGKILVGVGVLGLLAVVAGGGLLYLLNQGKPSTPEPVKVEALNPNLKPGVDTQDFSPNAAGKGGALLRVPGGAAEVIVRNAATGFRAEWDGTKYLRIRDIEPGIVQTQVRLKAGDGQTRGDFRVEADKTCEFTFKKETSTWEKGECR